MRLAPKITFYLLQSVLPYFLFAWILLSVILFVQQAGRFSDIFFSANIPSTLVWQLAIALIPNVIAFTCPMAVLVGVIIGLSRMQGDSELVAIRASGFSNLQIAVPIAMLGVVLSLFTFLINLYGVPLAARIVRTVAIQTAIYKLESPIEPGVFNTEIRGFTAYVKAGDLTTGTWKNIFIHSEDPKTGTMRLITSSDGRIDSSGDRSELVLSNAVSSTFTTRENGEKFVSEKLGEIRFAIRTRRGELIEKLGSRELSVDELGLGDLSAKAGQTDGAVRTEANIIWYRRVLLSISPLLFSLLGTVLVLRFSRGGRGFGIFMALISLVVFYLLSFLGEQLARTGVMPPIVGAVLPVSAALLAIAWFSSRVRSSLVRKLIDSVRAAMPSIEPRSMERKIRRRNALVDLTTGLRDFDILIDLLKYYVVTLLFLGAVFVVFTAFELWKFAGTMTGGTALLAQYLLFLLPFVYTSLAPSAAMIAILATYVIKSRNNEIVTWIAAGQSIYRLLLPCFVLMCILGLLNWQITERIAPPANRMQDDLRNSLRSRGKVTGIGSKLWVATGNRIYSFELPNVNNRLASDNEIGDAAMCPSGCAVRNLTIYEFGGEGEALQALYRGETALWDRDQVRFVGPVRVSRLSAGSVSTTTDEEGIVVEEANPFTRYVKKPSQLTSKQIREQIENTVSDVERRSFIVALEKRYSTLFLPLVIALFTAPFALSLSRKGKVVTIGYAVGLWLLFMGITSGFEQLGLSGSLPPVVAIWAPLGLFALLGVFLLSKVRT
jgi:lipopolysaccharide export LptBFGC system permease protein LptF